MADLGTLAQRVNSQGYKIFINSTDGYALLQNASLSLSHSEYREPTTSGGNVYYSGAPDNVLSGTLLYTTDLANNTATPENTIEDWFTKTNNEYVTKTLIVKLTDFEGTVTTYTFSTSSNSGAKMTSCVIYKGSEGAVKADISFILIGDPSIT